MTKGARATLSQPPGTPDPALSQRPLRASAPLAASTVARDDRGDAPHGSRAGPLPDPTGLACAYCTALVVAAFGHSRRELIATTRRSAEVAFARQVAMYLAHVGAGLSMSEVGRGFGRDRTTVAHACRNVEDRRDDPRIEATLVCLEAAMATWRSYADASKRVRAGAPR